MNITKNLIVAVLMTIVTTLLLGVVYPLVVTGLAQALFPRQGQRPADRTEREGRSARGSSARRSRRRATSASRPSAAGTGYDAANSAGTNLGPTNKKLIDAVKAAVDAAKQENPARAAACGADRPGDLVGLRPRSAHLAGGRGVPGAARGARARRRRRRRSGGWSTRTPKGRQFGFLGEPVVNVLELNLALDAQHPMKK